MISIILINWNSRQFLPTCLEALRAQRYQDYEVVIVDNHSTDGSPAWLQAAALPYRLFLNQENRGYCGGANQGIHATRGEFVLILNPDVRLHETFLEQIIAGMQIDPAIGIVTGKILRFDGVTLDSTGQFLRPDCTPLERGYGQPDNGQYNQPEYVFSACGAVVCYRRAMLEQIQVQGQYFDETYGSFFEDLDVGWRAQLLGWKTYYLPQAVAYHYRGGGFASQTQPCHWFERLPFLPKVSFTAKPLAVQRNIIKNRYLTIIKNASWRQILHGLPAIMKYEILLWGYVCCVRPALLVTLLDIARLLPAAQKKRRAIQARRQEGNPLRFM
jgi:GT2 family glycosyltransferase